MLTNHSMIKHSQLDNRREPSNKQRRTFIGASLGALLASPLLTSSRRAVAEETEAPNDPFILLLAGVYQPVVHGPKLGLSAVNLNDGSYSVTRIYPAFGISNEEGRTDQDRGIGNFYVQLNGSLCAYQLPGGAIAMQFAGGGYSSTNHPDGMGGRYLEGTFELTILQAIGIYRAFQGGHNHMAARTHQLANGQLDEYCFCIISGYQFP